MEVNEVKIKVATIDDLPYIIQLNSEIFKEEFEKYDKTINVNWPFTNNAREFYTERIKDDDKCAYVLFNEKGKIIGYLVGSISEDEFYRNSNIKKFAELGFE